MPDSGPSFCWAQDGDLVPARSDWMLPALTFAQEALESVQGGQEQLLTKSLHVNVNKDLLLRHAIIQLPQFVAENVQQFLLVVLHESEDVTTRQPKCCLAHDTPHGMTPLMV